MPARRPSTANTPRSSIRQLRPLCAPCPRQRLGKIEKHIIFYSIDWDIYDLPNEPDVGKRKRYAHGCTAFETALGTGRALGFGKPVDYLQLHLMPQPFKLLLHGTQVKGTVADGNSSASTSPWLVLYCGANPKVEEVSRERDVWGWGVTT